MSDLDAAYEEGWKAYQEHLSSSRDCPYPKGDKRIGWLRGLNAAGQADEEAEDEPEDDDIEDHDAWFDGEHWNAY